MWAEVYMGDVHVSMYVKVRYFRISYGISGTFRDIFKAVNNCSFSESVQRAMGGAL